MFRPILLTFLCGVAIAQTPPQPQQAPPEQQESPAGTLTFLPSRVICTLHTVGPVSSADHSNWP